MFFDKYFRNYLKTAYIYGVIRKFSYIYGTSYIITEKKEKVNYPILTMDYIIICNLAGYRSWILAPFYLLNDLRYSEIKLRNLNPKDYSIDKYEKKDITFLDLLFEDHLITF